MTNEKEHNAILIADDQAFIRSLLVSMLRDLGYRTLEAADGNQAMQQLAMRPDAAILDHRMAGLTGLEVLQAIRCGHTGLPRDLPVLMLTGHADEQIVRIASELDVSALLTKPVSKVQLRGRLKSAMRPALHLKQPQDYAQIAVAPAECDAPPRTTSNAWILRDAIIPPPAPFVSAAATAKRNARNAYGEDVHYRRLKPGMVLCKDIHSGSGRLLLAAGTELTEETVKRLVGICEDNPALHYLNVQPAGKARLYGAVDARGPKEA